MSSAEENSVRVFISKIGLAAKITVKFLFSSAKRNYEKSSSALSRKALTGMDWALANAICICGGGCRTLRAICAAPAGCLTN